MECYFQHMKNGMLEVLEADGNVKNDAFSEDFTESEFMEFVLDNLLLLLVKGKTSCDSLVKVICRTVYQM